jgi:alpha-beta hydrolase superfamily lysophospholipase
MNNHRKSLAPSSLRRALVIAGGILAVAIVLRALSPAVLSDEAARRTMGVILGIVVMVYANVVPKAIPAHGGRCGSATDQAVRRFTGWALVLGGGAYALIWLVAPFEHANWLAGAAMGIALVTALVRWAGAGRHSTTRGAFAVIILLPASGSTAHLNAQQALVSVDSTWPGRWEGPIALPGALQLRLRINLDRAGDGWTATFDSPDQGATGIVTDSVRIAGDTLALRVPSAQGRLRAVLRADGVLDGTWSQGPGSFPIVLRRLTGPVENLRPQHPTPPFPYDAEAVRFTNAAAQVELAGTLTLPHGDGPFPAVALVTGSGPQDRDQTLFGHKTFLVLSDHLTRAGIAVLRYDDRGVGESGGDFAAATSIDFADDAAAAVEFLKRHPRVNAGAVGLIGHSEGGLIAPLVATGTSGATRADLAFAVLLAPPALSGEALLYLQGAAIAHAGGATDSAISVGRRVQERIFAVIRAADDDVLRREALREVFRQIVDEMGPADRAAQGIQPGQDSVWIERQVGLVGTAWFRTFLMYDPRPTLEQLTIPTLAVFGGLDLQVPPEGNRAELSAALAAAGNKRSTVTVFPELNHLLQTARTGSPAEYGTIRETLAPAVLDAVTAWILGQTGR